MYRPIVYKSRKKIIHYNTGDISNIDISCLYCHIHSFAWNSDGIGMSVFV